MLSKQALQEILELLSDSEGNFIILEKDLPKFVILDFDLYKNIINRSKATAQSLLSQANDAVTSLKDQLAAYTVTQKVLITADEGALTTALIDKLAAAGHELTVITREPLKNISPLAKQVVGDFSDTEVLNQAFAEQKFQTVIHLAEITGAKRGFSSPEAYFVENVEKSISLLKYVTKNGVRQFIYKSTLSGISPYAKTKALFEDILKFYQATFGVNSIALRLPKVIEVKDLSEDIESELFENPINTVMAAASGKIPCLPVPNVGDLTSDGSPRLEVITLTDAVSAFEFSLKHLLEGSGSMIYKADPVSVTLSQLIEIVLETTHKMVATERVEPGELWEQLSDDAKLLSTAGWTRKDSELSNVIKEAWPEIPKANKEPVSLSELLAGHYTPFIKPHSS